MNPCKDFVSALTKIAPDSYHVSYSSANVSYSNLDFQIVVQFLNDGNKSRNFTTNSKANAVLNTIPVKPQDWVGCQILKRQCQISHP